MASLVAVAARASRKTTVPANESSEGDLCIEMRIRQYEDGAMSKLLASLAKVTIILYCDSQPPTMHQVTNKRGVTVRMPYQSMQSAFFHVYP